MTQNGSGAGIMRLVTERSDILQALNEGHQTQTELSEEIGVSVSSISRYLGDLEERSLVTRSDSRYLLTGRGKRLLASFERFSKEVDYHCRVDRAIQSFDGYLDYESPILEGCDVAFSDDRAPSSALNLIKNDVKSASHIQSLFYQALTSVFEAHIEILRRTDQRVRFVFPDELGDTLRSAFSEDIEELSQYQEFELYLTDVDVEYSVTVAVTEDGSKSAWVMSHTSSGVHAIIRSESEQAVEWAETQIEHALTTAEQIESHD